MVSIWNLLYSDRNKLLISTAEPLVIETNLVTNNAPLS